MGTYNKFGYGAESVLSMRVVLADGSIAAVSPDKTEIEHPEARTIAHTEENNLFFALRGAGSSYAVVTEFLYVVHHTPETLPAILLAWADNQDDLDVIQASICKLAVSIITMNYQRAGQDSDSYSVTISQEFTNTFWQNALTTNIYRDLFPPIMAAIRNIGRLRDGVDSFPVFLTVTDINPGAGRHTDVIAAAEYVKYVDI